MQDRPDASVVPSASQLKLTPRQEQAQKLLRLQRHTLLVGGSRSGKTTLLVHEIAERALNAGNSRHAILRLHANAARASIALDTLPKVFSHAFPERPAQAASHGRLLLAEERLGNLDRRPRRPGAGRKDFGKGIRHHLSQRVFADSLFLGAHRADASGASRRKTCRRPPITISTRPAKAIGPTFCSARSATRSRGSRSPIRTITRGCFSIRAITPPT